MEFDPARLRRGEMIVGAGAVVLLASMFFLKWYQLSVVDPTAATRGASGSLTGWQALLHLRWLILVTSACGLGLVFLQAARRAPALPASMSVIVTVLGVATASALVYRVLINEPGRGDAKVGAFVGLLSAIALGCGGYLSMRQEGVSKRDGPAEIPTVRLGDASGS